jgi:hypothetical protein
MIEPYDITQEPAPRGLLFFLNPWKEELLDLPHRVFRRLDAVADGARVLVQLVVAAAGLRLVSKEVHALKLRRVDKAEAKGLVPTLRQQTGTG